MACGLTARQKLILLRIDLGCDCMEVIFIFIVFIMTMVDFSNHALYEIETCQFPTGTLPRNVTSCPPGGTFEFFVTATPEAYSTNPCDPSPLKV